MKRALHIVDALLEGDDDDIEDIMSSARDAAVSWDGKVWMAEFMSIAQARRVQGHLSVRLFGVQWGDQFVKTDVLNMSQYERRGSDRIRVQYMIRVNRSDGEKERRMVDPSFIVLVVYRPPVDDLKPNIELQPVLNV